MNNDNILAILYYYWAICRDYYPTERQQLQHTLLILLCSGTLACPGIVIKGSSYYNENDVLKYSDIKTNIVKDPENPEQKWAVLIYTDINRGQDIYQD